MSELSESLSKTFLAFPFKRVTEARKNSKSENFQGLWRKPREKLYISFLLMGFTILQKSLPSKCPGYKRNEVIFSK
jgi:hypothetical protein